VCVIRTRGDVGGGCAVSPQSKSAPSGRLAESEANDRSARGRDPIRRRQAQVRAAAHPFVLVWQNYRAPEGSCWGVIDTFGVERSNNPGLYADDAFSADSVQWLAPGEIKETAVIMSISDLAPMPETSS